MLGQTFNEGRVRSGKLFAQSLAFFLYRWSDKTCVEWEEGLEIISWAVSGMDSGHILGDLWDVSVARLLRFLVAMN